MTTKEQELTDEIESYNKEHSRELEIFGKILDSPKSTRLKAELKGFQEARKELIEDEIKFLDKLIKYSDKGIKDKCDCGWCLYNIQELVERRNELEKTNG